jgi:hypothetical protein
MPRRGPGDAGKQSHRPALQSSHKLLESAEIAAGGLIDELAGSDGARVRQPGHGTRFGCRLRMHLR